MPPSQLKENNVMRTPPGAQSIPPLALMIGLLAVTQATYGIGISGQGTWESTLEARDLDGLPSTVEAYYDTALNITWLRDTNYLQTSGADPDGAIYHPGTILLTTIYGVTWRMPKVTPSPPPGCETSYSGSDCGFNVETNASELAHMFYVTLGNHGAYDTNGAATDCGSYEVPCLTNTGAFHNLEIAFGEYGPFPYWTSTNNFIPGVPGSSNYYYAFSLLTGAQYTTWCCFNSGSRVWFVHDGDVGSAITTIPIPTALPLFLSAVATAIGLRRSGSSRT